MLLSINLVLVKLGTGGQSIASTFGRDNVFNSGVANVLPSNIGGLNVRKLIVLFIFVVLIKILIDLYLKTKSGMLLRATGSNQQYVVMLARNPGASKILGLAIGNGLAALSGAVIIGLSLFKRVGFMKATTMVILGTVIYKACLQIAVVIGLPSDYNKLLMAVLFVVALLFGKTGKIKLKRREKNA